MPKIYFVSPEPLATVSDMEESIQFVRPEVTFLLLLIKQDLVIQKTLI